MTDTTAPDYTRQNNLSNLIASFSEDWRVNDGMIDGLFTKSPMNPRGREWTDEDRYVLVETSDLEDGRLWLSVHPSMQEAAEHARQSECWSFWFVQNLVTGVRHQVRSVRYTFEPFDSEEI